MKINNLLIIGLVLLCVFIYRKERFTNEGFSGFAHRSYLASTYWLNKPQIQHTFQDLAHQYPDHFDYFQNACNEKEPNNAELCRYHKHRFDPTQL